jgi:hypothetical protein
MKSALLAAAAVAFTFVGSADAGEFVRYGSHYNGYSNYGQTGYGTFGVGSVGRSRYGSGYGGSFSYGDHMHHNVNPYVNPGYGHHDWHDTTHYDYVPGGYQRHGSHFHYQPGQMRLHQDGHYDLHH